MNFLEALGLKFCGYWDRCFFVNNTKESGLIVEDKDGKPLYLKDLKPDDGNHTDIKIPECDLFCDLELSGLKDKKIEEIIKLL